MDNAFSIVEFIIEVISRHGILGVIVLFILSIFIATLSFFKRRIEKAVGKKIFDVVKSKKMSNKELLLKNKLFAKIKYWSNYRLDNINTDCPVRECIFVDVMSTRLRILEEEYLGLIESEEYDSLDHVDFGYIVLSTNEKIYTRWYNVCRSLGIPDFILTQFEHYIHDFLCVIRRSITTIFDSEYDGHNNTEKLYRIFDIVSATEEIIFAELEQTLDLFNGEFKTLKYKNMKCQQCLNCVHDKYVQKRSLLTMSSKLKSSGIIGN